MKKLLLHLRNRAKYPWPFWVKVGGISAVVHHADGSTTDLGVIAPAYARRWRAGTGAAPPSEGD